MQDTNLDTFPFRARQALEMSAAEAAQLVHVTRRTWELWESGNVMPTAKRELFIEKLKGRGKSENHQLVLILNESGDGVDVVSSDTYCSCVPAEKGNDEYVISSLAVCRQSGKPYIHRQHFNRQQNEHVLRCIENWKGVMER